ncbi:MAG: hypothetical protein R3E31_23045 [Chloroflexota bacterium]
MLTRKKQLIGLIMAIVLILAALTGLIGAQESPTPPTDRSIEAIASSSNYIPIQGRLSDAAGNLLDGTYDVTFRLYGSGSTLLCDDVKSITVADGLFSTYMYADGCPIDGRQLYLGIQVGDDPEMTPRAYVDNVPYAWSLRPGAKIKESSSGSILSVQNDGNGVGLESGSTSGVAIKATGTGIIQSTAVSHLWISGNGVRPFHGNDSTIIDMTSTGGARIYRGSSSGYKNVMLPITVPGQLYGQDVTLTDLDIYWAGNTDFDAITAMLMRRQTGVCTTSPCYETIVSDFDDHVCDLPNNPEGCVLHYDLSNNNIQSDDAGILYLTLELAFSGETTWIDIGGIRLTMTHD